MKPINLLVGGLTLFTAQGCKAPKQVVERSEHPNIIYVFPDQYRNQAMGFWNQEGFRDKVNFRGDPVHTPNIDTFARESMVLTSAQSNCPLSSPHRGMLLTGMYPNRSGVPLNCNSTRPISSLRDDAECIGDVFIEGHTDNKPINTVQFKDNWDLSVIRATSVVRILIKNYGVNPLQIQPSGRGEYMPVDDNETAEGRSKNRRTEIIMAPKLDKLFQMLQTSEEVK